MSKLGVHLTLMAGPSVPVPVPMPVIQALRKVEVKHSDEGRSGFQFEFQIGRSGLAGVLDYELASSPQLQPYSRVVLSVLFGGVPRVLMDGIITTVESSPANEPGQSRMVVTGEDVSCMMDRERKQAEHPALPEAAIALKIIAGYTKYGLVPQVIPPPSFDVPLPTDRVPVQNATDLNYLREIAGRFAYVFYVIPGPSPLFNTAYWGPPVRVGVPQRALTIGMGPDSNIESLNVRMDALAPTVVSGRVLDPATNQAVPVQTFSSLRPPLAAVPLLLRVGQNVRRVAPQPCAGSAMRALARAQAVTDSAYDAVTAEGNLEALRYGDLLHARALVGVRGAGYTNDGWWYVKSVTHTIEDGKYGQRFTIAREGFGATTPFVNP